MVDELVKKEESALVVEANLLKERNNLEYDVNRLFKLFGVACFGMAYYCLIKEDYFWVGAGLFDLSLCYLAIKANKSTINEREQLYKTLIGKIEKEEHTLSFPEDSLEGQLSTVDYQGGLSNE